MTFVKMSAIYRLIGAQAKWLIGRPQEALLCAKAKRQQQCFICAKAKRQRQCFLCESEATATNVLSARKRSDSGKCFLCESEATATNVFCAKAKRQQQCFICAKAKRQRQCFLCESEATATKRPHVMVMSGKIDNSLEHKKE
ncbi:hypothetical protein [Lysinibacillus xylanilyticus]|uniref:Uncharacterized protein n=1 Tax=Lysinibacillus xylanilyticus TaxID=582475 RepID=A0ABV3W285_9BACI